MPLRALMHDRLSEGARVTALTGEDEIRIEVAEAEWNDTDNIPVLLVEGGAQLRFEWLGISNKLLGLDGVQSIEVTIESDATLRSDVMEQIMKCPCGNATECP